MTFAALVQESQQKKEAWRYTKLAAFMPAALASPRALKEALVLPPPLTRHRLVFVNGAYREDLSTRQELPDEFFNRCAEKESCYALTLWAQTCLAIDPIELLFVNTAQGAANEAETKIKISLGENSRMTLIERHMNLVSVKKENTHKNCVIPAKAGIQSHKNPIESPSPLDPRLRGDDEKGVINARHILMEIDLAAQAKLVHGKIVVGGADTLHVAQAQVSVAAGAFYDHFAMIIDGKCVRCEKEVALHGALAEARFAGVMLLRGGAHGDMTTLVRHLAPHGLSRQICKTVLDDKARGVFQGKVHVAPHAQKTDACQTCRALLLSDAGEMDAKPELEIYADDVKCSHGTAIGDLDENALFYLLSRGIDEGTARAMLIEAFAGEVVDALQSPELMSAVKREVDGWLA